MKRIVTTCIATSTVLFTLVAHAESLEEKQYWKREQNKIDKTLASAGKACDTTFTLAWVDKPTFRAETEKTNHSPYGVCSNIINAVDMICRAGEDEKATVKEKIKGFTCGFAKERTLDMKGGVVKYMGNNNQANFSDWAKPWLLKRL